MATTDYQIEIQRPLAEYAYELKKYYKDTKGISKRSFMLTYNAGELELSTIYENLFVLGANKVGKPIQKVSEDCRDFDNNGDMKIGVLKKDGVFRRYVISNVENKIGTIYFVGWNWIRNKIEFHAIPKLSVTFPKAGIKIMRCKETGNVTSGIYNSFYHPTWDEFVQQA